MESLTLREFYADCNGDPEEFMRRVRFVNLLILFTMEPETVRAIWERSQKQ